MVSKPSVFLFDEPLSNIDAKLRVQMRAEIGSLQNRLKITSVYVTHDQVEAMTMGDRICVLNGGYIQQVGSPLQLYREPKNLFVARFIGTPPMNIMEGQISEDGRKVHMKGFDMVVKDELFEVTNHHRGRKVTVGIRPEHLTAIDDPEQGSIKVKGHVKVVEPLGHEVIVHCMIGEEEVTAKFDPDHIPHPNTEVDLFLYANHVHLFDRETENRLEA
jgi:multiple sugar transport system ATP-binding protein